MGNKAVSKQARRAAREAAAAAAEEVIRRTKANVEDLATFFDARERADAVDGWLAERQQAVAAQAAQRRAAHHVRCGTALRAMRDRGETLREIAGMTELSEKAVRELIRDTESPESAAEPTQVSSVGAVAAARPTRVPESRGTSEVSTHVAQADGLGWQPASARA